MVTIIGSVRLLPSRPVQPAFRHLPFALFLLGILAYGAALVWYMLLRFDLGSLLRLNGDNAFYYFQIARNLAAGEFSTFDGGITRTNGYHPLWLLLITPIYWIFDPRNALFAIKAFEILLIAAGSALIAVAARLARLPWMLLLSVPVALYQQRGMLLGLEAAAVVALLGLLLLTLVLAARNPVRWTWPLAAVAFSLPWVRLELVAVSVAATAAVCCIEWSRQGAAAVGWSRAGLARAARSRPALPLLGALAGLLAYFAYNGLVFGGLVPVSGATKQWWAHMRWEREGGIDVGRNLQAVAQTWPFDGEVLAALEVCAYLVLVWWLVRRSGNPDDRPALAYYVGLAGLAAGHLAMFVWTVLTAHPTSAVFPWYFVPAHLLTALLVPVRIHVALHLVRRFVEPVSHRAATILRPALVVGGAALLLAATDFRGPFLELERRAGALARTWQIASYTGTQVMNRVLPEGSVIGSRDAGVIGYFSRFPVVNLDGLANSYEFFRAHRHLHDGEERRSAQREYGRRNFGITYFANVRPVDTEYGGELFEGVTTSGPIKERRELKLWSTATPARMPGASERAARFWARMAPHFDYRADDVGVVVDDGLAQVFVRRCDPERLRDRKFAFAWVSGDSGQPASAWYPWESPRRNRLGLCVTVFEPPNGAVRIMALSAHDYTARLLGDARLLIRSDFDVYRNENQLVYVRDHCSAEDVERRFFVHVWPADPGDLSDGGQRHGFDNLDFDFQRGGMRTGGRCIAVRALPSYDIAHIRTGQFVPGVGRLWGSSVDFGGSGGGPR